MRNSLKQCAVILACSLFIFSVFAVFIWDVNREVIGQEDPQPPTPPPPPDPCPQYCGDNCCGDTTPLQCCGPQGTACCYNGCCCGANGGSCCHGECCSDMPCCPGQCCSKQTGTEPGPSGPTPIYEYDCCEAADSEYCCNEECSECKTSAHCAEKYNWCYICDTDSAPCQCKQTPYYVPLYIWDDWLNCPLLRQYPDKDYILDGCSPYVTPDDPTNVLFNALCQETTFIEVCTTHDKCYQTCDTEKSYNRGTCDLNFCDAMDTVCNDLSGANRMLCRLPCLGFSATYCNAVKTWGEGPWKGDQLQFCVCCGTEGTE